MHPRSDDDVTQRSVPAIEMVSARRDVRGAHLRGDELVTQSEGECIAARIVNRTLVHVNNPSRFARVVAHEQFLLALSEDEMHLVAVAPRVRHRRGRQRRPDHRRNATDRGRDKPFHQVGFQPELFLIRNVLPGATAAGPGRGNLSEMRTAWCHTMR
jgi:hypothetical protein